MLEEYLNYILEVTKYFYSEIPSIYGNKRVSVHFSKEQKWIINKEEKTFDEVIESFSKYKLDLVVFVTLVEESMRVKFYHDYMFEKEQHPIILKKFDDLEQQKIKDEMEQFFKTLQEVIHNTINKPKLTIV